MIAISYDVMELIRSFDDLSVLFELRIFWMILIANE